MFLLFRLDVVVLCVMCDCRLPGTRIRPIKFLSLYHTWYSVTITANEQPDWSAAEMQPRTAIGPRPWVPVVHFDTNSDNSDLDKPFDSILL